MNLDQNDNEPEILDVSPNNENVLSSDPVAKDSNTTMQNMNDEDALNDCENITPSLSLAGIGIIFGIMDQYISFLRSPTAELGIGIIRSIVNIVQGRNVVNLTLDLVIDLIRQEIANEVRNEATTRMRSINDQHAQYLKNLTEYSNHNPNMPDDRFERDILNHEAFLRNQLDSFFRRQGHEVLLLPNFVQVALYHLNVLRDGIIHGRSVLIPQPSNEVAPSYNRPPSNSFQAALNTSIRIYTNYCTDWYHVGLNNLRGSTIANWSRFNTYRTEMTIMVLDFVALFPMLDPSRYAAPTNIELSRLIYTEPLRFTNPILNSFSSTENFVTFPLRRATTLNSMQIHTAYYSGPNSQPSREYWSGNRNTLNNGQHDDSGYVHNDRWLPSETFSTNNIDIFRVDMIRHRLSNTIHLHNGIHRADFIGINTQTNRPERITYNRPNSYHWPDRPTVYLPGAAPNVQSPIEPNTNNYTHKLFQMKTTSESFRDTRHSLFSHSWLHKSLNSQNIYRSDQIAQIPAVKTTTPNADRAVLRGSGSTGGDLIRLDNLTSSILFTLTPANHDASITRFNVRIRYACMDNNIRIDLSLGVTQVASVTVNRTVQTGGSLENLRYEDFNYIKFPNNFLLNQSLSIVRNTFTGALVIDKIELIPSRFMSASEQDQMSVDSLTSN